MKFLHRFCAQEVQILLKKIEEDFDTIASNGVWYALLSNSKHMTRVEKFCVSHAHRKAKKNHERDKYLAAILSQQLNPKAYDMAVDGMVDTSRYLINSGLQIAALNQAQQNNLAHQSVHAQLLTGIGQYATNGLSAQGIIGAVRGNP